ncbi:MAG: hypothetical protein HOC77_04525 [Chloroflexi bacterium]|nr:hypothetical protein [Chloroflexota bacterium]MBT4074127.1 hypothetical protein [Chloroflexota bacterium]MBT4514343.1 hypothetical protein [Chloroflexota bacterium]MBT5319690.1 hypothetical protein [Chloroflexota bacterium]MBT6682750.1 hypothetical protein [Chloroflexota bacterium]
MSTEYHIRLIGSQRRSWRVDRLRSLSADFEPKLVQIAEIRELDTVYWFDSEFLPTCRAVIEHAERIRTADVSDPILLSPDGCVVDGMHRVARAFLDGLTSINAVQLLDYPEPDRIS